MRIIRKEDIKNPIANGKGELFYEMIGRGEALGNAEKHSLGHVVVLDGYSTNKHYHKEAEETYYMIKGQGEMIIEEKHIKVSQGDVILILPNEKHQLIANNGDIEAIVICAPAWEINNTVFVN
jgi:quercetin dioxygenase-like cupin family protein